MDALTIVTGGAGFIGSHLVEVLVAEGQRVRVVERPAADVSHLPEGVEIVRADIRDRSATRQALKGGRVVYHLAANPNLWARDRREFDALNHGGTIHVLDGAIAEGAERIVHTSTESILTRAQATGPITGDVAVSLADCVGPYCRSKLKAELEAKGRADAGHPVVIVNPTMPVGPGDRGLSPPTRLIRDFSLGKIPAYLDCTLNLVDVRDVASGLRLAAERGEPGRRYLIGGENLTLREFFAQLSAHTGVAPPRNRIPYVLGLAFAYLSEFWADWITGAVPQASITGVRLTRRSMHFDASRSLSELGLTPRPIGTAVAETVAWLREAGRIPPRIAAEFAGGSPEHEGHFTKSKRFPADSSQSQKGHV